MEKAGKSKFNKLNNWDGELINDGRFSRRDPKKKQLGSSIPAENLRVGKEGLKNSHRWVPTSHLGGLKDHNLL